MSEMTENPSDEWKNGYSDGSGKGTITFNGNAKLRVHWGCSCCDSFSEYSHGSDEKNLIKFADKITKVLNEKKVKA